MERKNITATAEQFNAIEEYLWLLQNHSKGMNKDCYYAYLDLCDIANDIKDSNGLTPYETYYSEDTQSYREIPEDK